MTNEDKMTVTFTAKELFQQINEHLEKIVRALESKASQEDVTKLEVRVDVLEDKARDTEVIATALLADKKKRFTVAEKVVGIGIASGLLLLNILSLGPDIIKF